MHGIFELTKCILRNLRKQKLLYPRKVIRKLKRYSKHKGKNKLLINQNYSQCIQLPLDLSKFVQTCLSLWDRANDKASPGLISLKLNGFTSQPFRIY